MLNVVTTVLLDCYPREVWARDSATTLRKLKEMDIRFWDGRNWENLHNAKHVATVLSAEGGELLELFPWNTQNQEGPAGLTRRMDAAVPKAVGGLRAPEWLVFMGEEWHEHAEGPTGDTRRAAPVPVMWCRRSVVNEARP